MPSPIVQHKIRAGNSRKVTQNLKEEPCPRRLYVADHEVLCQRIEPNPATSTRQLSQELGSSRWAIGRHLQKLVKTRKRCREVPYDLTAKQAEERVKICIYFKY